LSNRIAVATSMVALVITVLAVTPLGDAASRAVPTALFAKNAAKVNGIGASRTPRAGHLLPLNASGKFPPSVFVAGAQGPAGKDGNDGKDGGLGRVVQWTINQMSDPYTAADVTLYGAKAWALTVRVGIKADTNGPWEVECRLYAGPPASVTLADTSTALDSSNTHVHSQGNGQLVLLGVARAGSSANEPTRVAVACNTRHAIFQPTRILAVPASDIDINK
jgi:hypothetical protein